MKNGLQETYYKDGSISSRRWYNNGELHKEDGPAKIYYYKDGSAESQYWYKNGEYYREDGPAAIYYYKDGSIDSQYWRINGKQLTKIPQEMLRAYMKTNNLTLAELLLSNDELIRTSAKLQMEKHIMKNGLQEEYYEDGSIRSQHWHIDDELHREDGPAVIVYYKDGSINGQLWYIDDERHREDGPAEIWYYEDGSIDSQYWYVNGELQLDNNQLIKTSTQSYKWSNTYKAEQSVEKEPPVKKQQILSIEAKTKGVQVMNTEVVQSQVNHLEEALSPAVIKIRKQIQSMNAKAGAVSDEILSNIKTKESEKAEAILTESVRALNDVMSPGQAKSALSNLLDTLPFAKKAKEKLEDTVIRNLSIKDNIDNMFASLGTAISYVEKDLRGLAKMLDSLHEAINQGEDLLIELENVLSDTSIKNLDKLTLETQKRQLCSILLVNKETAKQVDMQLRTSHALSTNLNEIQPLIKGMLSCQTALAAQNARNLRVKRTSDIVASTINEMIKSNTVETNKVVLDTLKSCSKPVIERQTIEHLQEENIKFVHEFKQTVTEIQSDMTNYLSTLQETSRQLTSSSPDLLIEDKNAK